MIEGFCELLESRQIQDEDEDPRVGGYARDPPRLLSAAEIGSRTKLTGGNTEHTDDVIDHQPNGATAISTRIHLDFLPGSVLGTIPNLARRSMTGTTSDR